MGINGIKTLLVLIVFWFLWINVRGEENSYLSKALNSIKWNNYDARIRPYGHNGTHESPTVVKVQLFIRSIDSIDEAKMEYKAQLTFRMTWKDERLTYSDPTGKLQFITLTKGFSIWLPDVFFSNEKSGYLHHMLQSNVYLRFNSVGQVLYSTRMSITFSCPMDLKLYPLDLQICCIRLASYSFTVNELVFLWTEDDPVQIVKSLYLWKFNLQQYETDYCTSKTSTGEYSCIKVDFRFKRELGYYLKYLYFPYILIVFTSWIPFWLGKMVFIRLYINVTTLFLIILDLLFRPSVLPVPYTTAFDIWVNACMIFVILATCETAIITYSLRNHYNRPTRSISTFGSVPLAQQEDLPEYLPDATEKRESTFSKVSVRKVNTKLIDTFSQITFPICFVIFFLYYWIEYYFMK